MATPAAPHRATPRLAAGLVGICGFAAWWWQATVFDDAYITYRYAENWVGGHGLVFNPGGERVEGYTNPLWVFLSAAALALGGSPFTATRIIGVASYVAGIAAIAFAIASHTRGLGARGAWLVPAFACLVVPSGLAGIAGSGLETGFVGLGAIALGLGLLLRDDARLAAPLASTVPALLVLTRMDALIFVAAAILADAARESSTERREVLRRALRRLVPLVIALAGWTGFRVAYYESWLPNSYYAKGADEWHLAAGLAYLSSFVQSFWQVLPLVGLAVFGAVSAHSSRLRRLCLYALLSSGAYAFYIAKVGGDFMQYRFAFAPYLVLSAGGLAGLSELARRQFAPAILLGVTVGAWSTMPIVLEHRFGMQSLPEMDAYARDGLEVGPALSAALPAGTRVATTLAGTIAYESKLEIVDQWGLNERDVRSWEPLARFQRGHYKPATEAWLKQRGVELDIHHPEICSCEDLCTLPTPMLFVRLDRGRCLRGVLVAPSNDLILRACTQPDRFVLHGVTCPGPR